MGNAPSPKVSAPELKKSIDSGSDHASADQTLNRNMPWALPLGPQARATLDAVHTGGSPKGPPSRCATEGGGRGLAPRSKDPAHPQLGSLGLVPAAPSIIAAGRSPNRRENRPRRAGRA
jgi:hypothetical protein